jgi:hypothetical protein
MLLHEPELLSRERVHSFLVPALWKYIDRSPEANLDTSFSAFLFETLEQCATDNTGLYL